MTHRDGRLSITLGVRLFIDDSNRILASDPQVSVNELVKRTQQNVDLWVGLIHATGGKLNASKSCWSMFIWGFTDDGAPFLDDEQTQDCCLTMLDHQTNTRTDLKVTTPDEAVRLLGVRFSMDGNTKAEESFAAEKCTKFAAILRACPLSRKDAYTAYHSSFLPSVTYPLPATFIAPQRLDLIQRDVTGAFLCKMGYNWNMPHSVVFAPVEIGGIGYRSLSVEQGVGQVILLLKHIRARTTLGIFMLTTLEVYQLTSGLSRPVLEDTQVLPHTEGFWFDSVRSFLHDITGSIKLEDPWCISPLRTNDRHIMDDVLARSNLTDDEICRFNRCRLFLKVTCLSELIDHTGKRFIPEALTGDIDAFGDPILWQQGRSTLKWPIQTRPANKTWKLWARVLRELYIATRTGVILKDPLLEWLPHWATTNRTWTSLLHQASSTLFQVRQEVITSYHYSSQNRRATIYAIDTAEITTLPAMCELTPLYGVKAQRQSYSVSLPVWPTQSETPSDPIPTPNSFSEYIQRLPQWEQDLLIFQQEMMDLDVDHPTTLYEALTKRNPLFLVSDASNNSDKNSAYHWVIATAEQYLWEGAATVPGPAAQVNTGRSEGFGGLAAIRFLFISVSSIISILTLPDYCIFVITRALSQKPNGSTRTNYQ